MILNSYVCAVLPNSIFRSGLVFENLGTFLLLSTFVFISFFLTIFRGGMGGTLLSPSLSLYFFSPFGVFLLLLLVLGMLSVLFRSSFVAVGAPLRSTTA